MSIGSLAKHLASANMRAAKPSEFLGFELWPDHTVVKHNTESQAKDSQEQRQKVHFKIFSPLNECFILDGFKFLLSVSNSNSCSPSSVFKLGAQDSEITFSSNCVKKM